MKINVKHVAKLANLPLSPLEEEKFEKQLSETLDYVNQLEEIDTKGAIPTSQVTGLRNIARDDNVSPSLSQQQALANAKSVHNGLFKAKTVLKE